MVMICTPRPGVRLVGGEQAAEPLRQLLRPGPVGFAAPLAQGVEKSPRMLQISVLRAGRRSSQPQPGGFHAPRQRLAARGKVCTPHRN